MKCLKFTKHLLPQSDIQIGRVTLKKAHLTLSP